MRNKSLGAGFEGRSFSPSGICRWDDDGFDDFGSDDSGFGGGGGTSIASQIIGSISQVATAGIIASQANGQPIGYNNGSLSIGTGIASPFGASGQGGTSLILLLVLVVGGIFAFKAIK